MELFSYLTSFVYLNDYIPDAPSEIPELKTFPNIITTPSFRVEIVDSNFIVPKLKNTKHEIVFRDITTFNKLSLKSVITNAPNCFKLMYIQEQIDRIKEQQIESKKYYSPTLRYFRNKEKKEKRKRSIDKINQPRNQGFKIFRQLQMFK
jgi:hypothetical protein